MCSSQALPLPPICLTAMCSPQGAEEEDCRWMHGCERKIQHPSLAEPHRWRSGLFWSMIVWKTLMQREKDKLLQILLWSEAGLHLWMFAQLAWCCSCMDVHVILFYVEGMSQGLVVCQCSCLWDGSSLRDRNKAREHDRKSLNAWPLKNAGGHCTQKQVR